jgi:CheY-like chemotaxis protein
MDRTSLAEAEAPILARVLVVDDDPSILELVARVLRDDGHEVVSASDGRRALEALTGGTFELILLDMNMPVMDGWEFARASRAAGITAPIIVMTAAGDARHAATQIHARGHVAKPFDLDDLLETVRDTLS